MKYLVLLLLFSQGIFAQGRMLEGRVVNEKGEQLPFATLVLTDSVKEHLAEAADFEGLFKILSNATGIVSLEVSYIGYVNYIRVLSEEDFKKPLSIVLHSEGRELNELVIDKRAPLVKRKVDRLEFNIENSALTSLSGWEIIKQTPGITAQGSTLSIRGSSGILVTINGKKVMLAADELQRLLEGTPGKDIKSIEVITNPPANYDASGSAVLNIVMTKSQLEGYKTVVFGRYIQSKYEKGLFGLSQYYRSGKLSLMGSYYRGTGTYLREGYDVINYVENQTTWESIMIRKDISRNQNSYTFNMEYDLDSLTNFTFGANGYISPGEHGVYDVPTLIYNKEQQLESSYRTVNDHRSATDYHNLYLQADRKWGADNRVVWTSYLTSNHKDNFQNIYTQLHFKDQDPKETTFESINPSKVFLFSTQVDYSIKREKWNLDSGLKYSKVNTNSVLDFYDDEKGGLDFRPEKSNIFDYEETNFAAFTTLAYSWQQWSFKGGLRAEYTDLTGVVSKPEEKNSQNYLEWFPTFFAQYETKSNHQFGLSYGKRISRPSYSRLNPAKSYYNLFSYFQGDSQLKQTIIHNLNVTYSWNNWNLDVYYRKENLPSMEISIQDPVTNNLIYHYTNIEKGEMGGVDLSKNFELFPWWTVNVYTSLQYNENYFFGLDQELYENSITMFYGRASTNIRLHKDSDWNMEIGCYYHTPSIQGTFTISQMSNTYFIMNKKFYDKKIEASLMINDIFKTERSKVTTKYANQNNYFLDYQDSQSVSVSLRYNFGNQTIKNKRTIDKTEEQGRI